MAKQHNEFKVTQVKGGKIYERLDSLERVISMVFVPDHVSPTTVKQADGFNFLLGLLSRLTQSDSRVRPDEIKKCVMLSWELMGLDPDEFTKKHFSITESD